jgi:hypothetical protein
MADGAGVQEITFEQALGCTQTIQRDLLLGNGFSIGGHGAFDYRQLLDRASVPDDVRAIFASARTSNFEAVMRILLAETQGVGGQPAADARRKIEALKTALVHSIHEVHPDQLGTLGPLRNLSGTLHRQEASGRPHLHYQL